MTYTNEFKYYYWGPCLTRFILSDELNNGLLQRGNKLKEDARKGLAGHLNKELNYTQEDQDWFLSEFSPVIKDHMKFLNTYHNKNIKANIKLTNLWINYMKKGEFNPPHVHNQELSFVIYVQVPEKLIEEHKNYQGTDTAGPGGIKFINDWNADFLNIAEVPIFPKEKECYIFPGTLNHMVFPFQSDCERISVSGNFQFIQ
tara:strand:- start:1002 stop:1604 length:603 start_codon:yes stop_codon:yes gene_type:complete